MNTYQLINQFVSWQVLYHNMYYLSNKDICFLANYIQTNQQYIFLHPDTILLCGFSVIQLLSIHNPSSHLQVCNLIATICYKLLHHLECCMQAITIQPAGAIQYVAYTI